MEEIVTYAGAELSYKMRNGEVRALIFGDDRLSITFITHNGKRVDFTFEFKPETVAWSHSTSTVTPKANDIDF